LGNQIINQQLKIFVMKKYILKIRVLCFLLCFFSISFAQQTETAKSILDKMTQAEKIGQISGRKDVMTYLINSALHASITGKGDMVSVGKLEKYNIPALTFVDGYKGVCYHGKHTAFPANSARGCSFDKELEYRVGEAIGVETKAAGANYIGAVTLNLLRNPRGGRSEESYGEDPTLIGMMGVAMTKGIQKDHHVMACAKHFAMYSIEQNRHDVNIVADERTMHEVYLPHFKRVVQEGDVASIMAAYNKVNGEHCGQSMYLLNDIARKDWGFKGFFTSDWIWCVYDLVKAIKAGDNIEMPMAHHYRQDSILNAIKENKLSWEDIDKLVLPVIATKMFYGENKSYKLDQETVLKHRQLAQEAAEKNMVLLKNDNVLPFSTIGLKRILVVGDLAKSDNLGQMQYNPDVAYRNKITPLKGIRNCLKGTNVSVLFTNGVDKTELQNLVKLSDAVVLCVGYTTADQCDGVVNPDINADMMVGNFGGDRKDLTLHQSDIELINRLSRFGKKTAIVYFGASAPIVSTWIDRAPALLFAGYYGMNGGHALANILFGKVSPSGKLAYSVFEKESDYPAFPNNWMRPIETNSDYKNAEKSVTDPFQVNYDYYLGYTLADKKNLSVSFPFGFGLSYTKFKIDGVATDKANYGENDVIKVKCNVTNIGSMKGGEVVQVYAGFANAKVDRPVKVLKNFTKVYLEPNASSEVELSIPVKDLAYWDVNSKSWKVEKIAYPIYVGNSSRFEDLQKVNIEVQ
jgi:beta-glucosidase